MAIGLTAERGRGAGEQLGLRGDLGMHLHADDDLPVAGFAANEFRGFGVHGHPIAPALAPVYSAPLCVLVRLYSLGQAAARTAICLEAQHDHPPPHAWL